MTEMFHPDLPGRSVTKQDHQQRSARAAGWLPWDELTDEQQAAHEAAVTAARDDLRDLREAADRAASGAADLEATTAALAAAEPNNTRKSDPTPAPGDTTEE